MNLKEAIRDVLGVREVAGTDEWPAFCFSEEHDNRNTPAASVNVRKGVWVCYSCGRGGSVLRLLEGEPISDPAVSDYLADVDRDLEAVERSLSQSVGGHTEGSRQYPEAWLRLFTGFRHHAWAERGVTVEAQDHFSLGYDYETDCLTYPLRDLDGSLLGVVRRRLDDGRPKYKYPGHINVHSLLFAYHEAKANLPVVLGEGALDAVGAWDAVHDEMSPLALYGSDLSEAQELALRRLRAPVVICAFDNDEAGFNLTQQVMDSELSLTTPVVAIDWTDVLAKDLPELSVGERRKMLFEALDSL